MYALKFSGYLLASDRFETRGAARAALREIARDEATRCRYRYGSAVVRWPHPDICTVYARRDPRSPLWMMGSVHEV